MKKLFAAAMAVIMLASTSPRALAAEIVDSGRCGDSATWTLDSDGVLTVTGTGTIDDDYHENGEDEESYTWREYKSRIRKIVVESGITEIGDGTFGSLSLVDEAALPYGLKTIGARAFSGCGDMEYVNIPETVTSIGENAFYYCKNLKSITIPGGVTEIKEYTFNFCIEITSVVVPEGVTRLCEGAFYYCYGLENVSLPDSLEEIGKNAFVRCDALTNVTVPKNVKYIGEEAFAADKALKQVVFTGDAPQIAANAFRSVTADAYIPVDNDTWAGDMIRSYGGRLTWYCYDPDYVPSVVDSGTVGGVKWEYYDDGVLDITGTGPIPDYTAPTGTNPPPWAKYREDTYIIYIGEGITAVGENAFNGFTALEEVDFLGDAPRIASNAFTGVSSTAAFYIFKNGWTEAVLLGYGGSLEWMYMYLPGDVNVDGELTNADLVMMARYIVGLYDKNSPELVAIKEYGDMDGDKRVTNTDAVTLARVIVGLGQGND